MALAILLCDRCVYMASGNFCRVPLRPLPKPNIHPVRRVGMAIKSLQQKYGLVKVGKDAPEPLTNYLDVSQ